MTRVYRGILLAAGILVASAGSVNAQAIGSIFGKVTDPSGGVLPGVTVTVTGPALQRPLVATTSTSGTYQFPSVPIGTFTVTFELTGFKKAARANVVITTNFNAPIDQKMEIGQVSEEMTVTAAAPVVDTKKTTTGAVFTKDILENIPTARDPWQIIGMTPGVQAGLNVGGSASGQQVGLSVYGTSSNVQWNLEGGSITDLSSNSSPSYFNFDSFEQIQVTTGGGDVSVQSSGLSINLVSKSGSNVFKGTAVATFENDNMQANNVTPELFYAGNERPAVRQPDPEDRGLLRRVRRPDQAEPALVVGGGRQAGHQRRRRQLLRPEPWHLLPTVDRGPEEGIDCAGERGELRQTRRRPGLSDQRQDGHQGPRVEVQLPAQLGEQDPVAVHERQQVPQPSRRQLHDGD